MGEQRAPEHLRRRVEDDPSLVEVEDLAVCVGGNSGVFMMFMGGGVSGATSSPGLCCRGMHIDMY